MKENNLTAPDKEYHNLLSPSVITMQVKGVEPVVMSGSELCSVRQYISSPSNRSSSVIATLAQTLSDCPREGKTNSAFPSRLMSNDSSSENVIEFTKDFSYLGYWVQQY